MENVDVARVLDDLADLLEIQGANPFRIRAYRNAVRTVANLTRPLRLMVAEGEDLTGLPGVGDSMAGYITELLETGRIARMDEVAEEYPATLIQLMRLDGVGPKKAKKLYEELQVATVDDLEVALEAGKVRELAGFGARSAEKIQRAIAEHRARSGRFRIDEAEELVAGVLEHMEGAPGVERIEVAGSLRRRKETIGDVDLLALAEGDGQAVVDHFCAFAGAARVENQGGTKGTIVLHSGLSIDLRVIPERSFGAALQYFTGSKEHNVEVRTRAVKEGLKVNEWGVFRLPEGADASDVGREGGERLAGADEEGVYRALGMAWVPPELRENRGEVELARRGAEALPRLVELADLRGDLHMHSTWSDGKVTLEEMARACLERGYEYMAITDHSAAMAMVQGLTPEKARRQWEEVAEVREKVPGIEIFRSCEVDSLEDGSLDMPDEILAELDFVLVSVHLHMGQDQATMTERVLKAVAHPRVDMLGHPTGRLLGRRDPYAVDVEAVLQACAEHDVAVEINANPHRLDLSDVHAHRARELGVKVAVNTDAHRPRGLDTMRFGVDQARRGWLRPQDVLNCMSLEDLRAWTRRRDPA